MAAGHALAGQLSETSMEAVVADVLRDDGDSDPGYAAVVLDSNGAVCLASRFAPQRPLAVVPLEHPRQLFAPAIHEV